MVIYLPFITLITACLCCIYKTMVNLSVYLSLLLLSIILAFYCDIVSLIGALVCIFFIFILLSHKYIKKTISNNIILWIGRAIICSFVLFASFHLLPGFNNVIVFDKVKLSELSAPFRMYFNFDNFFVMSAILTISYNDVEIVPKESPLLAIKKILKWAAISFFASAFFLIGFAYLVNFVKFDIKFNASIFLPWVFNNLFIVCLREEMVYRYMLLREIKIHHKITKFFGFFRICISSLIFALMHLPNIPFAFLAFIAGLFYSISYLKDNRIECAIITHFLVNLTHLIFFSYPYFISV